jgi:predicted AAA+ superfamily ATPase
MPDRARLASKRLLALLRQFPAVAILGARQVGKSTLARNALPGFSLLDLEDPGDFRRLAADPAFALGQQRRLVVDEAQRLPELFPVLRSFLDRHPRHKVVLLGSASPGLVRQISESLAGRLGMLELGGISLFEAEADRLWVEGGFPRVHWSRPRAKPADWYPAYLRTCLERDVPQLGYRVSSVRMRNLLTIVANGQGSVSNLSELGAALGLNYHSVSHLLDIFEGIFLVRRLPPFFANVRKRLVKSPKLYVRDTGLLHTLLGIPFTRRALLAHPKAGASFETFAIEQILQHARLADPSAEGFFYRTHGGVEVDLVLRLRGRLLPIEIKLGVTPPATRNLERCMQDLATPGGWVVNLSEGPLEIARGVRMAGLREFLEANRLRPRS